MKETNTIEKQTIESPDYAAKFWMGINADAGIDVKVPSGVTVTLRQYPLHEMLLNQRLPKRLQAAALHVYNEGATALDIAEAAENIGFMDAVIVYSLIAPQVCDGQSPAPAGAVTVHEIPIRDRLAIFSWALGGVAASDAVVPF